MHIRSATFAAAVAVCSPGASAALAANAVGQPDDLLKRAEAERPDFLATLEQLVSVDTGTGHGPGLSKVEVILTERLDDATSELIARQVRHASRPHPVSHRERRLDEIHDASRFRVERRR